MKPEDCFCVCLFTVSMCDFIYCDVHWLIEYAGQVGFEIIHSKIRCWVPFGFDDILQGGLLDI